MNSIPVSWQSDLEGTLAFDTTAISNKLFFSVVNQGNVKLGMTLTYDVISDIFVWNINT